MLTAHDFHLLYLCPPVGASLLAQTIKNLPAMWETQLRSLSQEDPLEKGMATHSRILAWRIPWMEEPCRLQSMGLQRVTQLTLSVYVSLRYLTHHSKYVITKWLVNIRSSTFITKFFSKRTDRATYSH